MASEEPSCPNKLSSETFLERYRLIAGIFLLGVILLGLSVLIFKISSFTAEQPKVEILGESDPATAGSQASFIVVEASGEVQKPGVYKLNAGSRVGDLLTAAGGLSAEADREWVAKNVNMAAKLQDGVKIYIPSKKEMGNEKMEAGKEAGSEKSEKININTASEAELDTLWGVGPATAKKIVEGRPYQKPEELLEKKIVNKNVWEKIKDKITIY